jgi:hypothetical protein
MTDQPNVEPEAFDTVRTEVQQAYADNTDADGRRCLSFCSSQWVTPRDAGRLCRLIGSYNGFSPELFRKVELWADLADADPTARCAVGREGSPVVYVDTERPDAVMETFGSLRATGVFDPCPDELDTVDYVGLGSTDRYGDGDDKFDPHMSCHHDTPVVPVSDYPRARASVVRVWWD